MGAAGAAVPALVTIIRFLTNNRLDEVELSG